MAEADNNKLIRQIDLIAVTVEQDGMYAKKNAVTEEINEKIAAKLGSTYTPAGTIADISELPDLAAENVGKVYNVAAAGTTTEDFVEGAGNSIKEGDNIAVVSPEDGVFKYDNLSGIVDTTGFALKTDMNDELTKKVDKLDGMGLSANDFTDADKAKLDSLEVASTSDVLDAVRAALGVETPPDTGEGGEPNVES